MKRQTERWAPWLPSLVMVASLMMVLTPLSAAPAATARQDVVILVRSLGYGAGIHHFKNYVLRGLAIHYVTAKKSFNDALQAVQRLEQRPDLEPSDQPALNAIKTMIQSYTEGLDRVAQLRAKEWRLEDIDRSVRVDDSAAIAALDQLRARWVWSDLEEIEYQLGYGKGIHNFKNYVLRQQEHYHTNALENLLAAESAVVNQFNNAQLTREQRSALEKIGRVAQSYRNYLSLVGRLHAMQRSVRQIDLAVKVNDEPAVAGLTLLAR